MTRSLFLSSCLSHFDEKHSHCLSFSFTCTETHTDWLNTCITYTTHLMKHSGVTESTAVLKCSANHNHTSNISQTNSDSWLNQTNNVSPVTYAWTLAVYLNWPSHTSCFHGNLWQLSYINASNMGWKYVRWTYVTWCWCTDYSPPSLIHNYIMWSYHVIFNSRYCTFCPGH